MKILIESALGANRWIAQSYASAFRIAGHEVFWWEPEGKSPHDIFTEIKDINIFLGHTWRLTRALVKNLIKYKDNMSVVLFANHFGEMDEEIISKYAIELASDQEKTFVQELLNAGINLKGLICQYFPQSVNKTHGYWKDKVGIECHGFPLSADVTSYYLTKPSKEYYTQISFCGGRWPYKEKNLDKYLSPLCYENKYKIRIFGSGWNVPQAVGRAEDYTVRNHYASSDCVIHLYEPHVALIGDNPQRAFQAAACGAFGISQPAVDFDLMFSPEEIPIFNSKEELDLLLEKYLVSNNLELTSHFRKNACKRVYREHTNFHRTAKLARLLDIDPIPFFDIADQNYLRIENDLKFIYGE